MIGYPFPSSVWLLCFLTNINANMSAAGSLADIAAAINRMDTLVSSSQGSQSLLPSLLGQTDVASVKS